MNYEASLSAIATDGFRWELLREYFSFGDITLREGNYKRLVEAAIKSLDDDDAAARLLDLLDAQASTFLEQVWVQNEQMSQLGQESPFVIEGTFSSTWLQIHSNLRHARGLPPRDLRHAMLNLPKDDSIASRIACELEE